MASLPLPHLPPLALTLPPPAYSRKKRNNLIIHLQCPNNGNDRNHEVTQAYRMYMAVLSVKQQTKTAIPTPHSTASSMQLR
jgi:predicted phage tail protein